MKKKRYKKMSEYPPNVPRALIRLYRANNENGKKTAQLLGVHDAHLSVLLKYGREPIDDELRKKLMLRKRRSPRVKRSSLARPEKPDFIKKWEHLPKEERHKVIKQYLNWKENNNRVDL